MFKLTILIIINYAASVSANGKGADLENNESNPLKSTGQIRSSPVNYIFIFLTK